MTYVKRQNRIEQISDMLDSAMRQANVARRQEGRRQLDDVLHITLSPAGIERCEGED
jgi:hypothetical protein